MKLQSKLKPICAVLVCLFSSGSAFAEGNALSTEDISILGQGQTRQVQSVSTSDMKNEAAGTSALKVLEKLPGVHFTSSDPWGSYEWSTRFNVRGFSQQQMGFTLDGVPLGDMSYGNNNGLHISRAISSENIRGASVSQGAGALGTASSSNLGGTVEFFSIDPADKFGVHAEQTLGSNSTSRTFARLDSGRTESGTKGYLSYTNMSAKKWKGWGNQDQQQLNTKIVHLAGENRLSAFANTSDRKEVDYADLSIQSQQVLGWGWDNYAPDWQTAINAANGTFTPAVQQVVNGPYAGQLDAAYYLGRGLRKDFLGGLSGDLKLSESARLATTLYHHTNQGQGQWYTPYSPTSVGNPISIRTTEYKINRTGVTSTLSYEVANHEVKAGVWLETSNHDLARRFYASTTAADQNYLLDPSSPLYLSTGFEQKFVTKTSQFHAQDTVSLADDKVKVAFGFKSPTVNVTATNYAGTRAQGVIEAKKTFLPQIGVNYKLNDLQETFASYSQNVRAYQPGVNGPFSASQAGFDAGLSSLKPEESTNIDIGWRFKGEVTQASVTAYMVDFKNRQLAVSTCPGIAGCPTAFGNVGKVHTQGLETALVWNVAQNVSWLNALTLNDSKYQDDYMNGATLVATGGKTVVDAPKTLLSSEVAYESAGYFSRLGMKYTDKRYVSYLNDSEVPAYMVWNFGVGYKMKKLGSVEDFSVQFNITNLFDKKYFSTVGSNGFVVSDPNGNNMTMQEGAPRQFFVSVGGTL